MRIQINHRRQTMQRGLLPAVLIGVALFLALDVLVNRGQVADRIGSPWTLPSLPLEARVQDRVIVDWFTSSEWEHRPAWSRDGSQVALVYRDATALRFGILSAKDLLATGTSQARLLVQEGSQIGRASWHPNGTKLVVDFATASGWVLREYDLVGTNRIRTLPLAETSASPDHSPDGKRIVFAARRRGPGTTLTNLHLRIYDTATRQESLLVAGEWDALDPRWSPDGTRIAYLRSTRHGAEIWCRHLKTGRDAPIHSGSETTVRWQCEATWIDDGRYIAVMEFDDDATANFDGGHVILHSIRTGRSVDLKRQARGQFIRGQLAWRPGTRQLLCRVEDGLALLQLELP